MKANEQGPHPLQLHILSRKTDHGWREETVAGDLDMPVGWGGHPHGAAKSCSRGAAPTLEHWASLAEPNSQRQPRVCVCEDASLFPPTPNSKRERTRRREEDEEFSHGLLVSGVLGREGPGLKP